MLDFAEEWWVHGPIRRSSKWWIVLGDIRVNAAAHTEGDAFEVVRALSMLYTPPVHQDDEWCPYCEHGTNEGCWGE